MGIPYGPPGTYLIAQIHRSQGPEDDTDSFCYAIYGNLHAKNVVAND